MHSSVYLVVGRARAMLDSRQRSFSRTLLLRPNVFLVSSALIKHSCALAAIVDNAARRGLGGFLG